MALHIVISGFLFCYTLGVFNTCADNVGATLNWGDMQDTYTTIFSTIMPVGALLGAMASGNLMNTYGRRKSIMMSDVLMMAGSCVTIVPLTTMFGIGRFITGVSAGIFMTVPPSFVNEITPDEMMPRVGPLVQISTNVGLLTSYAVGLPLPTEDYDSDSFNKWWYFMFLLPAAISLYQFIYFWAVCKQDSALWLISKGRTEEAMLSLELIYTEEGMKIGMERFGVNNAEAQDLQLSNETNEPTYTQIFTDQKYRKMMRVGISLGIIQQVSGINAGIFYSTSIYKDIGISTFMSRVYTCITSIVFMIAGICTIPLLEKFGRKTLIVSGEIFLAFDLFLLVTLNSVPNVPSIVLIFGVILIFILFAYSLGGTLWMYCGEALIEKIVGVSATINLMFVCIVAGVFPVTVTYLGISYAFGFFGACMGAAAVYCTYDLIETKGKTKPEILKIMYYDAKNLE